MSERIFTGTFYTELPYGGSEAHKYLKVEKTSRGKTTTKYFITEDRELLGDDAIESVITEMRSLAAGLSDAHLAQVEEYYPYEEIPTHKIVVRGERAATSEEIILIEEGEAADRSRREAHEEDQREHLIAQLKNEGYDVVPKS